MKRLLLSTAFALGLGALTAPAALAAAHGDMFRPAIGATDISVSDLVGMRVYLPETVNPDLMEVAGLNDG